jgi:hypothetical protein
MAGRETNSKRAFSTVRTRDASSFDKAEARHRSLYCVAIGTDPAGREHRIKIREEGSSFAMVDSRRRCRVAAHWACRLVEEDIAKEVAFVFRVKVNAFEYPEPGGDDAPERMRPRKAQYWKSWGRRTVGRCA